MKKLIVICSVVASCATFFPDSESLAAYYADTFSNNPVGQGLPIGWTGRWNTVGNEEHWSTVSDGFGGKSIKYTHDDESNRPKGLSLDAVGSTGDAEILAKVKILSPGNGYQALLNLCGRGGAGSHTMFFVTFQDGKFFIARNVNGGGYAVIGPQMPYPVTAGESHLVRFRVESGGYLYAKAWLEGTVEPAQWSCVGQDAVNYAAGWVGTEGYNTDAQFDWVSVATNGGTAQFPEGSRAYYADTFSDSTIGQGLPVGWTGRWNTVGNEEHWSTVSDGFGGKSIKYTHDDESNRPKGLSLDVVGSTGDAEILAKVKILSSGNGYQALLNLCGRGGAGSHTMFFVTFQDGKFFIARNVNGGGYAVIGPQMPYPVTAGESHLVRFRVESGGYLYAKAWLDGTAEPAQWFCVGQDAVNYAAGWVGLEGYNTDAQFDWVSVATNGGTAQFPEGSRAYYADTFSDSTIGQGLPIGWTGRWNTVGNEEHWSTVSDGFGGKSIKYTHDDESNRPKGLSLDAAGLTCNAEILAKVKVLTSGNGYQALLNLCGKGDPGFHTMFFVTLQGGKFYIARNVNGGGYAVIGSQMPYPITVGESHLIRFRVEPGGYLYAKAWLEGTAEPAQWSCVGQDAVNYAAGWVGIEGYNTDAQFDWVSVATNGGTAQFLAGTNTDDVPPVVTITTPVGGSTTTQDKTTVSGTVVDDSPVTVQVNGLPAVVNGADFSVLEVPLTSGSNTITATASDSLGNTSVSVVTIIRSSLPPTIEPQPDGSYGSQYQNLIPSNATKTAYDPKRFSVITGEVRDQNDHPLPGVTISVNATSCVQCHGLEFGSVQSDAAGKFSIPVEGGSTMTVVYQKASLMTSHRQVYVPWNEIAIADTIQMLPQDAAGTSFSFDGNPQTVFTHRSTPVTDASGTRSATLVFSGDTNAYEVDSDGAVIRQLSTVTARATEYTTPEAMPANLPSNSAFTYCAELSVDGVERVRFDRPVTTYIENFLDFPVGMAVPVGYYDRDRGVWVPADNGVVVRLLDTNSDGVVDALDSDGDNLPNDLNNDGSFIDEVKGLSDPSRYPSGGTFWRVAVTHFTPWDCNWPYVPPEDAIPPNPEEDPKTDKSEEEEEPCTKTNSFVKDLSHAFHEDIPIPGTEMTLHYSSDRVPGYKHRIMIPVSGATVPESAKRITARIELAGRVFEKEMPALPNQVAEFVWDGLDYLGRAVNWEVTARGKIGFIYDGFYVDPRDLPQAFGQWGGAQITAVRSRQEMILWKNISINAIRVDHPMVDPYMKGWSLSSQHRMHPGYSLKLSKGDGTFLKKKNGAIINTIAGYHADGLAVDSKNNIVFCDGFDIKRLDSDGTITTILSGEGLDIWDIAIDNTGNIFISDIASNCIRKITVSGAISNYVGRCTADWGYSGDGGPAQLAQLDQPMGIDVDASGNLYIVDQWNHLIRKVDTNGIITTVVGKYNGGVGGTAGDGGPANEAFLSEPSDVVVDKQGNLFIPERSMFRIRKVDTNGLISTFAGQAGQLGYSGDGGPANLALLGYLMGLALDATGNLYITDSEYWVIRKVDTNGRIYTVAGSPYDWFWGFPNVTFSGDGGPATSARLYWPQWVAIDQKDNILITDKGNSRIRKVDSIHASEPYLLDSNNSEILFPEDSGFGYIMSNATGHHLRTIELATGLVLKSFSYDVAGNLISITDQFGNITTITRDSNGGPISITSPSGITTQLTVAANGHLTRVTYPDNSYFSFEYTSDGLMTAEVDPNGNRFTHIFDYAGRTSDVFDPEEGHWTFDQFTMPGGKILARKTTGEGDVTTYLEERFSDVLTTTITGPSGGESVFTHGADGLSTNASLSCGTTLNTKYGLDPQYKYKFKKEETKSTPAGLSHLTLRDRTYQDTNADGTTDRIIETTTINGNPSTRVTDTLLSKIESVSSLGRKITTFYDPNSLVTERLIVPGLTDIQFGYDTKGRLTSILQGAREIAYTYEPQGFLASVIDPESRITTYGHDSLGRVTDIHRPDGSHVAFTFDKNGNMTVLANPSSVTHGFVYNGVDKKTNYETPLSGSYSYLYDRDRRLKEIHFPSGRLIHNVYLSGNLQQIQTPEGNVEYAYACAGKVGGITKGSESITFGYDGPLTISETSSGTLSQSLGYTYNGDFYLTGFNYAGGTVSYSYDTDGLLTGAGDFAISRNGGNGLAEMISGGTYSLTRSFSGYGEIDGETTTIGGVNRFVHSLSRSPAGLITGKTETVSGEATNLLYTYDELGRLTSVTKDGTLVEQYQYDAVGRRNYEMNTARGIAGRSFAYSNEDHLVTAGEVGYQYDLDGFLTTKTELAGSTGYTYSSRGELLKVVLPDGQVIEYLYDPQGRRIAKKIDGVIVEKYLWQGLTRLLAVYSGSDTLVARFQYAGDRLPVAMTKGISTYYLCYDQVGSLRLVTDSAGTVVKQINFDSFGNLLADSNPTFTVPFGFAGGLHDRDINLVRFGFRDYDPETGRWTAKDPIGFNGGDLDLFGYVQNNPINWIDPWGLLQYNTADTEKTGRLTGATLTFAQCLEKCAGFELTITGGSEKTGHSEGSKHYTGEACDFSDVKNPKLDKPTIEKCYKECSKDNYYGQKEGGDYPHWHFQIVPGVGDAKGLKK